MSTHIPYSIPLQDRVFPFPNIKESRSILSDGSRLLDWREKPILQKLHKTSSDILANSYGNLEFYVFFTSQGLPTE